MRIFQWNKNHRVAARGDHAAGQPHHGVLVAPNADAVPQREAAGNVGYRLVMTTGKPSSLNQVAGLPGMTCAVRWNTDHHGAHIACFAVAELADLHGQVGDIGNARHAR